MSENQKQKIKEKKQELKTALEQFNILMDSLDTLSLYDPHFDKKYQEIKKEIRENQYKIDKIESEIYFLEKKIVAFNDNIDLYLEQENIETGHCEFAVFLHETATRIGKVRVDKQTIMPFANIGYKIEKEYQGHHFALQSLELLRETLLKMEIRFPVITVIPTNIASVRTIQEFGGKLIEAHNSKERYYDTYEVNLLESQNSKKK